MVSFCTVFSGWPGSILPQRLPRKFASSGDITCSLLLVFVLGPLTHILILLFDPSRASLYPRTWPTTQYPYSVLLSPQLLLLLLLLLLLSILLFKGLPLFGIFFFFKFKNTSTPLCLSKDKIKG